MTKRDLFWRWIAFLGLVVFMLSLRFGENYAWWLDAIAIVFVAAVVVLSRDDD
jgi:cell division protein FtsW (lipid II flippase)